MSSSNKHLLSDFNTVGNAYVCEWICKYFYLHIFSSSCLQFSCWTNYLKLILVTHNTIVRVWRQEKKIKFWGSLEERDASFERWAGMFMEEAASVSIFRWVSAIFQIAWILGKIYLNVNYLCSVLFHDILSFYEGMCRQQVYVT